MNDAATPAASRLHADSLRLAYDERLVVDGLTTVIPDGLVTAIVGPNACGKSTLLRALSRLLTPVGGAVFLDGGEIHRQPTREVAKRLGLLPQSPVAPEGITVAELVSRGRQPHQRWYQGWTSEVEEAVARALTATGLLELADEPVTQLSGGQRQRVWIALAVAQDTPILLLDEPTTSLDLAHQVEVLELLVELNAADQRTIVMVIHDLNQAARYADHLIVMADGAVVVEGFPGDIVTADLVEAVFGLAAEVIADPVSGSPLVVPIGRHRPRRRPSIAGAEDRRRAVHDLATSPRSLFVTEPLQQPGDQP